MNIWKYIAIERRWPTALILVLSLPVEKVKDRAMKKSRREINVVPENENRARKLKSCRNVEVVPESWSREKKLRSWKKVEVVKKRWGRAKKKLLRNTRWHYGGQQLSRQKKKTHGKRKNLTAKRKRLTAKEKTSQQKKKTSRQKEKTHVERKNLFCREVIFLAVGLLRG